jgi:hypothetical protein
MIRKLLITSLLIITLSACSTTKLLEIALSGIGAETANATLLRADAAQQLSLHNVEWFVVTEKNLPEFLDKIKKTQKEVVFYAMVPKSYENLSLNFKDIRRYIKDQKSIIVFYENFLFEKIKRKMNETEKPEKPDKP